MNVEYPALEVALDPMCTPTLVGDVLREPGQTFAQAWRQHIEFLTLNCSVEAQDPTEIFIY